MACPRVHDKAEDRTASSNYGLHANDISVSLVKTSAEGAGQFINCNRHNLRELATVNFRKCA